MILGYDVAGAAVTGWLAVMLFGLFIVSGPKDPQWVSLPAYLRFGFFGAAVGFMLWSVNLASIPQRPADVGHINASGLWALAMLAYLVTASVVYVLRHTLQPHAWAKIAWVMRLFGRDPSLAPVLLRPDELAAVSRITAGGRAAGPGASAAEVFGKPNDDPHDGGS